MAASSLPDKEKEIAALKKQLKDISGQTVNFNVTGITEANTAIRSLNALIKEANKKAEELEEGWGGIAKSIQSSNAEMTKMSGASHIAIKNFSSLQSIAEKLKYNQQDIYKLNVEDLEKLKSKAAVNQQEIKDQAKIIINKHKANGLDATKLSLDANGKELSKKKLADLAKRLHLSVRDLKNEQAIAIAAKDGFTIFDESNKLLDEEIKKRKKIEETLGTTGALIKGISKIPIIGNLINTNKALKEMEKVAEGGGGKLATMGAGLRSVGNDIIKHVTDPLTLVTFAITSLFQAMLSGDKAIGELAKGMNMSYKDAGGLRTHLNDIKLSAKETFINTANLAESLLAINASMGTNAMLSEHQLVTMTKLRVMAGYTNDELAQMYKIAPKNGDEFEKYVKSFSGTVLALNAKNKLAINERTLLKEALKITDSIRLSVGGTAEKLAESVYKAKQFGVTLSQADQISKGLLDFESSIQNELEAELLTGKDLNLERARLLAINGDIAGAAAEILEQIESSAEFAGMNRIQQEAIAKAVGLSRDELAKSLVDREALVALGGEGLTIDGQQISAQERYNQLRAEGKSEAEIANILGSDSLAKQYEQMSVQEKLNAFIEQFKELLVPIADALLPLINEYLTNITKEGSTFTADISKFVTESIPAFINGLTIAYDVLKGIGKAIKSAFGFFIGLYDVAKMIGKALFGWMPSIKYLSTGMKSIAYLAVAAAAYKAFAAASVVPVIGPVLGAAAAAAVIAAGAGLISGASSISDGHIGKDGGLIVSGEKGSYQLDKNDSVIAGTNLMGMNDGEVKPDGSKGSISFNSDSIVNELKRIEAMLQNTYEVHANIEKGIKASLSKKDTIYMDSTHVGTATNIGTYKVQ